MNRILFLFSFVILLAGCETSENSIEGKTIVLDPGHGGTAEVDHYRVGPTGEREEWINLRVALMLQDLLIEEGAEVLMTRTDDSDVGLQERAQLAVDNNADLFLSIHHNAIADTSVNFPVVYFHGNASENRAGLQLGKILGQKINDALFDGEEPVLVASDHTIFTRSGTAVLRHSYGIPGIITEASFFTNPDEEQRLKEEDYNRKEAEALVEGISEFFEAGAEPIKEKFSKIELPSFPVLQAEGRMSPEVLGWKSAFEQAQELRESSEPEKIIQALEYATESAHLFPDSPVAKQAHELRAELLERLGRPDETHLARKRSEEFYKLLRP
ncbi:cell wall hydrolase [Rhodohalobacter sp. SW132]|uniref:N-acetylmuramoyl-L-alanine amidase n=1 Tax=Rhodohalobacter sp. SW132 TaxID=2293433 RepID=UPI000E2467DC|nr:N-acetylmuramoyl-L-alanine amidase [Rhodohalobacter sp. SW132]REL38547.1 cell wall hydrolase [Rhodohalobacter sp. SW132]